MTVRVPLMSERVLDELAHETLPLSEAVVARCLEPTHVADLTNDEEARAAAVALLRTGAVFVLNAGEAEGALDSMWDAPELAELPPLPFARIVIEARDENGPAALNVLGEGESVIWAKQLLIGLIERVPGNQWDLLVAYEMHGIGDALRRRSDETTDEIVLGLGEVSDALVEAKVKEITTGEVSEDGLAVFVYRISPAGVTQQPYPRGWHQWLLGLDGEARAALEDTLDEQRQKFRLDHLVKLAVTAAHLITADRVRHSEIALPRAQRREHQRRYRAEPPRVYFVDLAAAGEERRGVADRQYHVRWLVRGHWRLRGGTTFVASKGGMCTWVKPYIKGPPGAPWKGRPVHQTERSM